MIKGAAFCEEWELKVPFVISRSSRTHATVVYLEITDGMHVGRAECQPNKRYNETPEQVISELSGLFPASQGDLSGQIEVLKSTAAANALDCALFDLAAKQTGLAVSETLGVIPKKFVQSVYTISVGSPEEMGKQAKDLCANGITHLKLKLAGAGDDDRVKAVRQFAPAASLVVDANEAWDIEMFHAFMPILHECAVQLVEQPFPAGKDEWLKGRERPVAVCADESCHHVSDIPYLKQFYDAVNIKLDKTGGLSNALSLLHAARSENMQVMVGCMLGTSLAMAPAYYVASIADFVDLDGPALLKKDRKSGLVISEDIKIYPPQSILWG